jgi:galactokinase/mevalonate kinase-like predicted kinase
LAATQCWDAILKKDLQAFGLALTRSFKAQHSLFPNMADTAILNQIAAFQSQVLGYKLSGAGGGGYLVLVAEQAIEGCIKIRIRRKEGIC